MRGEALLYLHFVAGRYRFEPRPNLNRLIQQEQDRLDRDEVLARVRDGVEEALGAAAPSAGMSSSGPRGQEPCRMRAMFSVSRTYRRTGVQAQLRLTGGSSTLRVVPASTAISLAVVEPAPERFDSRRGPQPGAS